MGRLGRLGRLLGRLTALAVRRSLLLLQMNTVSMTAVVSAPLEK
jgi:hypothetical protein